jgi:hypothetical protein
MIRHKPTGHFSTGGMSPTFTTKGKVWNSLGALKNHLNFATDNYWNPKNIGVRSEFRKYPECEIVSFEMISAEKPGPFEMVEYLNNKITERKNTILDRIKYNPRLYRDDLPITVTYTDGTKEIVNSIGNDNTPNN